MSEWRDAKNRRPLERLNRALPAVFPAGVLAHALARPYHGSYGAARLERWANRLDDVLAAGRDVYAYFNNDWFGHAVRDATRLRNLLCDRNRTCVDKVARR